MDDRWFRLGDHGRYPALEPIEMNKKIPLQYFFVVTTIAAIAMPFLIAIANSNNPQYVPYLLIVIAVFVVQLGLSSLQMRFAYRWIATAACPALLIQGMLGIPGNWPGSRMFDIALMLVIATIAMGIANLTSRFVQKKSIAGNNGSLTCTENAG